MQAFGLCHLFPPCRKKRQAVRVLTWIRPWRGNSPEMGGNWGAGEGLGRMVVTLPVSSLQLLLRNSHSAQQVATKSGSPSWAIAYAWSGWPCPLPPPHSTRWQGRGKKAFPVPSRPPSWLPAEPRAAGCEEGAQGALPACKRGLPPERSRTPSAKSGKAACILRKQQLSEELS